MGDNNDERGEGLCDTGTDMDILSIVKEFEKYRSSKQAYFEISSFSLFKVYSVSLTSGIIESVKF
jgi:hypothetical protein